MNNHLVTGFEIGPMLHQALDDVHETPSRCSQQWALALSVLGVDVATRLAERSGNCGITVPCSTMQRGLLLLEGRKGRENNYINVPFNRFNLYVNMLQRLPCRPDRDWHECCTDSSPRPRCHSELPHGEQFPQTEEEQVTLRKQDKLRNYTSILHFYGNCKEMIVGDILLFKAQL